MAETRSLVVFMNEKDSLLLTEVPHPKDGQFMAYHRADGQWLGVDVHGAVSFGADAGSFQAFKLASNAPYLIAYREPFGGKTYRLGYLTFDGAMGPVA